MLHNVLIKMAYLFTELHVYRSTAHTISCNITSSSNTANETLPRSSQAPYICMFKASDSQSRNVCERTSLFQSHTETFKVYSPAMDGAPVATISSNRTYAQQQAPARTAGRRSKQAQYIATIVGKAAVWKPTA
jgi:hypothetical protein